VLCVVGVCVALLCALCALPCVRCLVYMRCVRALCAFDVLCVRSVVYVRCVVFDPFVFDALYVMRCLLVM
jgi:hypothetical protein